MKHLILFLFFCLASACKGATPSPAIPQPSPYVTATDGAKLRCTFFSPPGGGKAPAVLVLHVGGFKTGQAGPLNVAQDLARAGYWGIAAEYPLAPPGQLEGQRTAGHYPEQTDAIKLLIAKARKDPRFNGEVYGVGGSAGGSHVISLASFLDKVVALSPAIDFTASPGSEQLIRNAANYVGSSDKGKLLAASPVTTITSALKTPIFIIASDHESMPPEQYTKGVAALTSAGCNFQKLLVTGTAHAFQNWSAVKPKVLAFLATPSDARGFFPDPSPTATPTATPAPSPTPAAAAGRLPYPKGIWGSSGGSKIIDPNFKSNKGLVGATVTDDWDHIETSPGVFNWTFLDRKIAALKAAGFKFLALGLTASSENTPRFYTDDPNVQTIDLIDPGQAHKTYCQPLKTPLYWDPIWQAKRLAFIKAAGEHFSGDSAIVAIWCQFLGHNSNDWNVNDAEETLTGCPNGIPDQVLDQPKQWLAAGWTRVRMLEVGKVTIDAWAAAFPRQNLKLPIGGLHDALADAPVGSGGVYSTLAQEVVAYIATRPYNTRLYIQRNTVSAKWGPPPSDPSPASEQFIKKMIADALKSGLQTVAAATNGAATGCRQNGNVSPCPDLDVMQRSLDAMVSYHPWFAELWAQDSNNPAFHSMIKAATIALGGKPRP